MMYSNSMIPRIAAPPGLDVHGPVMKQVSVLDEPKLFVGNLPKDVTADELRLVFSMYGYVADLHVMSGQAKSGASCAFVTYDTNVEADSAVRALHGIYKIRQGSGDAVIVRYAKKKEPQHPGKVFVGNLPQAVSEQRLRQVFGKYGSIVDLYVIKSKSRSGQRCAFVEYKNKAEGQKAIDAVDHKFEIDGSKIVARFAPTKKEPASHASTTASFYASNNEFPSYYHSPSGLSDSYGGAYSVSLSADFDTYGSYYMRSMSPACLPYDVPSAYDQIPVPASRSYELPSRCAYDAAGVSSSAKTLEDHDDVLGLY